MKRNAIILLLFASSLLIHAGPDGSNEATVNIMLNDETDCTKYRGRKLKQCLACLSLELFLENLANLSAHARKNYFDNLSEGERKEQLKEFTVEAWQLFYNSLEEDERAAFEATLEQQKKKWIDEPEAQQLEAKQQSDRRMKYLLVGGGGALMLFVIVTNPPLAGVVVTKLAGLAALGKGTRKIG